MFVWVPYQRARNMETSHAEQITKLGLEKDAEINRLNAQSTTPQAIIKDDASDKIITDLRLKLADSERRNDKAENTIGNMQAKIEKLRSELEQAQGQFRSAIAKQDDKNSKAVIRAQLGGFLGIGHAIWTHCGRRDYRDACLSNDWVNQVKTFLSDNFDSSYVERFEHPRIESALGYEGSEVRSRSLVKLKGHIEFLKEVIKELS